MILELKQLFEQELNSHRNTVPIQDTLFPSPLSKKKDFSQFMFYLDKEGTVKTKSLTEQVLFKTNK